MCSLFMASWNRALVASLLVLMCRITQATTTCPDPKTILPCICSANEQEIQVWCGQSELSRIMEALKALTSLQAPIDELIFENNVMPSLPGQVFMPLKIVRLMIRDNGLERVSSNWLLGLETSLLELYIVEPGLRSLPDDSLSTLPKLEAITLNVGAVKQIPSMAGLARLRYIYIQAPEVTEISSQLFISLPYLEQIHVVSSPKISRLDQGLLSDLPRLTLINMTRCGLSWLHPRAFARLPALVELALVGNRFASARTVGAAVRDLPVLSTIRLDENEITQVEEGAFVDIPSLRHLSLTRNRILGVQRGAFYRTPLLRSIDLSHNQVQIIHAESFIPLSDDNVEEMRLSYNQIEHALTLRSILDALPRLRLLDLSHNRIVDILFGTLRGHPTLEILLLNDNQITRIGQEALSGMPSLRELNLRNNSLTSHLDFPIWNLPSLKGVDLSHNRIRRIDRRVMANLPSLRRVDLSYNTLALADSGAFLGNPALEIVNMSHNSLVSLSHAPFAHLVNLYELDVSYNRLKEFIIGLPQGLEFLRIARNQITAFPRPPAPEMNLVNLKFMDISGNGLHHIPTGMMKSLKKLRWLNVGDNALTTLDDQALKGLSSLEALDLRNNRLLSIHPMGLSHLHNLVSSNTSFSLLLSIRRVP
ncbi:protein artichoke-like [Bemisia tabaci]|uniref:protein artichoke-like n=1 Tax=Bemisia tabaci TaxID=7038 RepID=UPI003B283E22